MLYFRAGNATDFCVFGQYLSLAAGMGGMAARAARKQTRAARAFSGHRGDNGGSQCARGAPVSPHAKRVAANWDVDLSAHRARNWQPAPVDLVVAMTGDQLAQLHFRFDAQTLVTACRETKPRIAALGSYATRASDFARLFPLWSAGEFEAMGANADDSERDIFDPYGGSFEAYQECGERILRGVRALARSL